MQLVCNMLGLLQPLLMENVERVAYFYFPVSLCESSERTDRSLSNMLVAYVYRFSIIRGTTSHHRDFPGLKGHDFLNTNS